MASLQHFYREMELDNSCSLLYMGDYNGGYPRKGHSMKKIKFPYEGDFEGIKDGELVLIYGTVYTLRDAAVKKLLEYKNLEWLKGACIYHAAPTPPPPHHPTGAFGPTTSKRFDPAVDFLLQAGVKAFIGKGTRSKEILDKIQKNKAAYFVTFGGAGAYLAKRILKAEVFLFPELGPEAIYKLEVRRFPAFKNFFPEQR